MLKLRRMVEQRVKEMVPSSRGEGFLRPFPLPFPRTLRNLRDGWGEAFLTPAPEEREADQNDPS